MTTEPRQDSSSPLPIAECAEIETSHGGTTASLGRLDLRALLHNASWTSASVLFTAALSFAEVVLLARFLGAAAFGLLVLIRAYPEAVQQILDCRTKETVVRYLGEFVATHDHKRAGALVRLVWAVDVASGLVALAVVVCTAGLAARYIAHDPTVSWLIAVYALTQFVGTLDSASGSVIRVFDRFKTAAAMGVAETSARFTGVLLVLLLGGGIPALIYMLVGTEVAYTLGATFIAVRLLRRKVGFRFFAGIAPIRGRLAEVFRFLLHTNIAGTLKMSSDKLVTIIIGAFGGQSVTAQYKVAAQVGTSLMLLSDPFYTVIYPSLAKLAARREWRGMFDGLRRLQRFTIAFSVPGALLLSVLIIPLLPLIFGHGFKPAVTPAIIIIWAMLPNIIFFWLRPLLLSLGESGRLARYRGAASALHIALALLLIPFAGALGAAAALFAMQWLYALLELQRVAARKQSLLGQTETGVTT